MFDRFVGGNHGNPVGIPVISAVFLVSVAFGVLTLALTFS